MRTFKGYKGHSQAGNPFKLSFQHFPQESALFGRFINRLWKSIDYTEACRIHDVYVLDEDPAGYSITHRSSRIFVQEFWSRARFSEYVVVAWADEVQKSVISYLCTSVHADMHVFDPFFLPYYINIFISLIQINSSIPIPSLHFRSSQPWTIMNDKVKLACMRPAEVFQFPSYVGKQPSLETIWKRRVVSSSHKHRASTCQPDIYGLKARINHTGLIFRTTFWDVQRMQVCMGALRMDWTTH